MNSQIKDETALGKLMHDFACTNVKDMYYEVLADRVCAHWGQVSVIFYKENLKVL